MTGVKSVARLFTPKKTGTSSTYTVLHDCTVCGYDKHTEYAKFCKGRHLRHRKCKDEVLRQDIKAKAEALKEQECRKCKTVKSVDEFNKNQKKPGYYPRCKPCVSESQRRKHLKAKFGLTPEDYQKMSEDQNGVCAICKVRSTDRKGYSLPVDHCHTTGQVRGLLCDYCNQGIGSFQDNPDLLMEAIKYLEKYSK